MDEKMVDLKEAKKEFEKDKWRAHPIEMNGLDFLADLGCALCEELEIARRMVEDLADVPYEEALNYQRRLDRQREEKRED